MRQPDFQKLFFDHFGKVPRKVSYSVRQNSNRYHDLVFLSSLIHDARFKMSKVTMRGKRLSIPINRDCWELGIDRGDGSVGLYTADSLLTISPVHSVQWCFSHGLRTERKELWIADLWLDQPTDNETRDLVIDGHEWSCVLTLRDEDIRVKLKDAETPSLHSERTKQKRTRRKSAVRLRRP